MQKVIFKATFTNFRSKSSALGGIFDSIFAYLGGYML